MSQDPVWEDVGFMELNGLNSPWRGALDYGVRSVLSKGQWISQGNELFFLSRGKIRLVQQTGGCEKILWHIGADCIFGETPFLMKNPQADNFVCTTECEIYSFPEATVRRLWQKDASLLVNLAESMAYKIRMLSHQTASMCFDSIVVRVCKFLAQNIIPGSSPPCASLGMSQCDMANLLGINRITLYKVLNNLREGRIIAPMRNQRICLLNPEALNEIANSRE